MINVSEKVEQEENGGEICMTQTIIINFDLFNYNHNHDKCK